MSTLELPRIPPDTGPRASPLRRRLLQAALPLFFLLKGLAWLLAAAVAGSVVTP